MNNHVNGIVRSTRRLLAIEEQMALLGPRDEGRAGLAAMWQAEFEARQALVLAAIQAGVTDDLMSWAIEVQTPAGQTPRSS